MTYTATLFSEFAVLEYVIYRKVYRFFNDLDHVYKLYLCVVFLLVDISNQCFALSNAIIIRFSVLCFKEQYRMSCI